MSSSSTAARTDHVLVAAPESGGLADVVRILTAMRFEVSSADSASAAVELATRHRPAAVVADVNLGGPSLDLRFAAMLGARSGAAVVLVTGRHDQATLQALAGAGASAVLRKPVDARQLELTLLLALERRARAERRQGAACTCGGDQRPRQSPALEDVLRRIAAEIERAGIAAHDVDPEPELLSALRPREQQVVRLLLRHYRVPAIARELAISPQTVRNHLKHVFRQVGVHSQQELLARIT